MGDVFIDSITSLDSQTHHSLKLRVVIAPTTTTLVTRLFFSRVHRQFPGPEPLVAAAGCASVFAGTGAGAGAASGTAGTIVLGFTAVPSVAAPVEKPVLPEMPSPPGGSTPSGEPVLRPSMPFNCGTSSRFSGFTRSAVLMNISSDSCRWKDVRLNRLPSN